MVGASVQAVPAHYRRKSSEGEKTVAKGNLGILQVPSLLPAFYFKKGNISVPKISGARSPCMSENNE